MPDVPSSRILAAVTALPVRPRMRILEIGCGPGAAARELVRRHPGVVVLGIDRSATAIRLARAASRAEIARGTLDFRCVAVESFEREPGEPPFDLAFALRVGALDGRHPETGELARARIAAALSPRGRLFIDGGNPLRELQCRMARTQTNAEPRHRVFSVPFAKVYPLYLQKAERKGRTKQEVDRVITWLTGYSPAALRKQIASGADLETFFGDAPAMNPAIASIKGVVCGVRVEEVEDPLMRNIRYLDKLVDELAKGWPLEKIFREVPASPRARKAAR